MKMPTRKSYTTNHTIIEPLIGPLPSACSAAFQSFASHTPFTTKSNALSTTPANSPAPTTRPQLILPMVTSQGEWIDGRARVPRATEAVKALHSPGHGGHICPVSEPCRRADSRGIRERADGGVFPHVARLAPGRARQPGQRRAPPRPGPALRVLRPHAHHVRLAARSRRFGVRAPGVGGAAAHSLRRHRELRRAGPPPG